MSITFSDHRKAVLERAGYTCELARLIPGHECNGGLQAMHVLPKQSIRAEQSKARIRCQRTGEMTAAEERLIETPLEVIVCDAENGMSGCADGHRDHDLWRRDRTGRLLRLSRSALPDRIFDFAEHYALDALLDREFPLTNKGGTE